MSELQKRPTLFFFLFQGIGEAIKQMSALVGKSCLHHPKETLPTEMCSIHFISAAKQGKGQLGMSHLSSSP